jgi:hypothetical protein
MRDRRSEVVEVSTYKKEDGTQVREHTRRKPIVRGKLKFRMSDRDFRVKGKVVTYGTDGKAIDRTRINESSPLSQSERMELKRIQDGLK